jgi:hypothetical protein
MRCGRAAKAMTWTMSPAVMASCLYICSAACLASGVGDVVGQFGRDDLRFDDHDADIGLQFLTQRFRPAVEAPFGGGVDRVAGPGGAAGDGGQIDQVATAVAELVEEHLRDGHGPEQVGLDHAAVVVVPFGGFGARTLLLVQRMSPVLGDLLPALAWWGPVSETPSDFIPDG